MIEGAHKLPGALKNFVALDFKDCWIGVKA
jgi:hypothetical protein